MGYNQPNAVSFVDGIVKGGDSAATLVPNPVGEGPYFVFNDPYATLTGPVYLKEMTVYDASGVKITFGAGNIDAHVT